VRASTKYSGSWVSSHDLATVARITNAHFAEQISSSA